MQFDANKLPKEYEMNEIFVFRITFIYFSFSPSSREKIENFFFFVFVLVCKKTTLNSMREKPNKILSVISQVVWDCETNNRELTWVRWKSWNEDDSHHIFLVQKYKFFIYFLCFIVNIENKHSSTHGKNWKEHVLGSWNFQNKWRNVDVATILLVLFKASEIYWYFLSEVNWTHHSMRIFNLWINNWNSYFTSKVKYIFT